MKKPKTIVIVLLAVIVLLVAAALVFFRWMPIRVNISTAPVEPIQLQSTPVHFGSQEKLAFSQDAEKQYAVELAEGRIKTASQEEANELIAKATFATGAEKENLAQELRLYGIYLFPADSSSMDSVSGDISMTAPHLYYTANTKTWTVAYAGQWTTSAWNTQIVGSDMGSPDAFGIEFTDTSGPYETHVVSSHAYLSDQFNEERTTTYYRSDGVGSKGFGFILQDKCYKHAGEKAYIGYKWYASTVYDEHFASYNCLATGYYTHA